MEGRHPCRGSYRGLLWRLAPGQQDPGLASGDCGLNALDSRSSQQYNLSSWGEWGQVHRSMMSLSGSEEPPEWPSPSTHHLHSDHLLQGALCTFTASPSHLLPLHMVSPEESAP